MQDHCIPVINLCTKLKRTGICMVHGLSTLRGRERKKPDDSLYGKWKRITHGMALGRKNKKARIPPSNLSVIEVFSPLPYGSIRLWAGNFIKKGQKTGNGSQSARKFETRSVHRFPVWATVWKWTELRRWVMWLSIFFLSTLSLSDYHPTDAIFACDKI